MPDESNQNSQTPDQPAFSETQVKTIADIVNSAVTSHLKRAAKEQPDVAKLVADAVKAAMPTPPPPSDDDDKGKKSKVDPETAALRAKLDELEKQYRAETERATKAEQKAREDRALGQVKSALTGKIRGESVEDLSELLWVRKRIELDENGTPFIKVKRATHPGLPEEEQLMPLADGLDVYLKSKEGAAWLPAQSGATQTAPTQSRGSRFPSTPATTTKYDKEASTDDERVRRAIDQEARLRAQGLG